MSKPFIIKSDSSLASDTIEMAIVLLVVLSVIAFAAEWFFNAAVHAGILTLMVLFRPFLADMHELKIVARIGIAAIVVCSLWIAVVWRYRSSTYGVSDSSWSEIGFYTLFIVMASILASIVASLATWPSRRRARKPLPTLSFQSNTGPRA